MTDPVGCSTPILTVAALLGALAFAVPASAADAATVQSYTCADSQQSGATSASLSLTDPPTSITAGQVLSLQAHLTLTLPQAFDLTATADLVSQVGLSTTTFGLQVQIGNTVKVVPASIVIGQLQTLTIGGSDEASAALTFPAVSVPSTATGDVVISMPTAAQYPNSATSTPTAVVFNGVLEQQSYLGTPSSVNLACYDASTTPVPAAQVIAQIPIQASAATTKATTPTKTTASTQPKTTTTASKSKATKSATHGTSTTSTQTSQHTSKSTPVSASTTGSAALASAGSTVAPAAGTSNGSGVQEAPTAAAASSVGASSPTTASSSDGTDTPATTGTPVDVTIPPRTVGSGTFIPTWEVILMGSVLPIAALWYAWYMRRNLAAARSERMSRSEPLQPDESAPPQAELASTQPTQSFATRESQTRT